MRLQTITFALLVTAIAWAGGFGFGLLGASLSGEPQSDEPVVVVDSRIDVLREDVDMLLDENVQDVDLICLLAEQIDDIDRILWEADVVVSRTLVANRIGC